MSLSEHFHSQGLNHPNNAVGNPSDGSQGGFFNHPLLPAVVASNIHQSFHLTLPTVKSLAKASMQQQQGNSPPQSSQQEDDQALQQVLYQSAEAFNILKRMSLSQQNNLNFFQSGMEDEFNMEDVLEQQQHAAHHDGDVSSAESTEFLIKMAGLLQLQQAETEMFDSMLDGYLKDLKDTLGINDGQNAQLNHQVMAQNFANMGAAHSPSGATPSSPTSPSNNFTPTLSSPAVIGQKKPEEVISELKKKYSGQVLQVAQQKKKKKNFTKDATDQLNLWFFNHLNDPYPTDDEKKLLAQATNLTLSQVNNWFGNKRMRYKRKMLEQNRKGLPPNPQAAAMSPGSPSSMSPTPPPYPTPQYPSAQGGSSGNTPQRGGRGGQQQQYHQDQYNQWS